MWRGYRFRFYALDHGEPPHVHIWKDGNSAKVWLRNLKVETNHGYNERELNRLVEQIAQHRDEWINEWNRFFDVRD